LNDQNGQVILKIKNQYSLPYDFVKFGVKVHPKYCSNILPIWTSWYKCYHGTGKSDINACAILVSKILAGSLGRVGDVTMDGYQIGIQNWKPGDYDPDHQANVFTSPSIHYASSEVYSISFPIPDIDQKAQLVFQIRQNPGFKTNKSTIGEFYDSAIGTDEVEWRDNRRDSHVITGILIRRKEFAQGIDLHH